MCTVVMSQSLRLVFKESFRPEFGPLSAIAGDSVMPWTRMDVEVSSENVQADIPGDRDQYRDGAGEEQLG